MLITEFDLSKFEEVEIVPIADVHLGSPQCNEALLKGVIDYILQEPENPKRARITCLNGDLTNNNSRTTKVANFKDVHDELSPLSQLAIITKYLKPLTKTSKKYPNGKIFSYNPGNHEHFRMAKESDITMATSIACNLGLEDRFDEDGCYTFIKLKAKWSNRDFIKYTVYNQHMNGGGGKPGGKLNRVVKMKDFCLADLYVGAHVHWPLVTADGYWLPDARTNTMRWVEPNYLITNSYLFSNGGYGERSSMSPVSMKVPRAIVKQDRKYIQENNKRVADVKQVYTQLIMDN